MNTNMGPVCCPVCTLFMREGISLETHLNTHPKDQVIDALVRYCVTGPNIAENNSSGTEPVPTSQDGSSQHHDQSVLECTPAHIPSTQYPAFGSSHFTAAITYQQFLSSNATAAGTVIPQYVSVPTILAAPNPNHGNTPQPALMPVLYNPYLMQQQQQQVQFYNSVRTQPAQQTLLRQVLPAPVPNPSPMFPQHLTLDSSCAPVNNCSLSSTSTVLQVSQNTQTNISSSTSSVLHVAQVGSPVPENAAGNNTVQGQNCSSSPKEASVSSPKSPVSNIPVQCNQQQQQQQTVDVTTSIESDEVLENSQESLAVPLDDSAYCSGNETQTVSRDKEFCDYGKVELMPVEKEEASSRMQFENEREEEREESNVCSPMNPTSAVKCDLNIATAGLPQQGSSECSTSSTENQNGNVDLSTEVNSDCNLGAGSDLSISDVIKNGEEVAGLSDIMGVSFVVPLQQETEDQTEYIISDCSYPEEFNDVSYQHTPSTVQILDSQKRDCNNLNTGDNSDEIVDFDSSQQVNVIEIDGMHIFVPSQFLENPTEVMDRKVTVIQCAANLPLTSSSNSMKIDEGSSKSETVQTVVNLDMQTDELMPPRGELSEQESVGGNDTSMWPQNFPDRDDDVSTSYDLLARESWEASDGSDMEAGDNLSADCSVSKPSIESVVSNDKDEVEKKKKITVGFKCWTCDESFNCPKERRVHHSTKHGKGGVSSKTNRKVKSKSSQFAEGKQEINEIKEESQEQNLSRDQNDSAQFAQVFIEFIDPQDQTVVADDKDKDKDCNPDTKSGLSDNTVLRHSCSRCDATFVTLKCLQRHIRAVHKDHKFKHICGTCKETFSSDSLYHAHLKIHPLECIRCGKYFYRRQNLNLHIKRHLGIKPYKCAICDKAFVTKQKLAEHTNCHTGNSPLKCSLCNETFRRYSNLIQHKNRYHLKRKKKIKDFICTCGEIFHSKRKLEWHKEIHDEKPKSCSFCSERFVHASSLTRHVRHAHDKRYVPKIGREKENVECPVCSCVFIKSSLPVHMRIHSGERPYPCHICAKGFTTKWNLQLHRWTHASRSSKPFKCSLCKSAFFRRADYTSHMHSHRNERPYTCNYCGCQFIRKYNCLRHVREHETVKSFACNVCNKTFHRSYYLKEHMRIHSGVRPFTCHICGKASSTKSNHNKHVKIHHAREPVNTEG